jgi:hypothetical protein
MEHALVVPSLYREFSAGTLKNTDLCHHARGTPIVIDRDIGWAD